MSASDDTGADNLASHTLAYLRRMDKRLEGVEKAYIQMVDILKRQDLKMGRLSRQSDESAARIERELREIKSDAVLAENRILDRLSETIQLSLRLDRHDERLDELEQAVAIPADEQGTTP